MFKKRNALFNLGVFNIAVLIEMIITLVSGFLYIYKPEFILGNLLGKAHIITSVEQLFISLWGCTNFLVVAFLFLILPNNQYAIFNRPRVYSILIFTEIIVFTFIFIYSFQVGTLLQHGSLWTLIGLLIFICWRIYVVTFNPGLMYPTTL